MQGGGAGGQEKAESQEASAEAGQVAAGDLGQGPQSSGAGEGVDDPDGTDREPERNLRRD